MLRKPLVRMGETPQVTPRVLPRLVAACLALGAPLVPAQEPPPEFPSESQVVRLDLVVRDSRGRPVRDLRQGEVQVLEDGVGCEIVSFRYVRTRPAAASPADGPQAPGERAEPTTRPAALPQGQPRLAAIVFDQLDSEAARRAARAATEWAERGAPPDAWLGVYKVGPGLRVLQPLTPDRTLLGPAIRRATTGTETPREAPIGYEPPSPYGPSTSATEQAYRQLARQALNPTRPLEPGEIDSGILLLWDRARRMEVGLASLGALMSIVKGLERLPGRKAVVYFSVGLEVPGSLGPALLQEVVSAANRANVAFYAVDARGLGLGDPLAEKGAALDAASAGAVSPDTSWLFDDVVAGSPQSNLRLLASATGGLTTANTEGIGRGLARVTEDLSDYYEIAYAPPRAAPDGRFHRIQAKLARPGLSLRTRSGYYATARSSTLQAYELPLVAALAEPTPRRDFLHRAAALRFAPRGDDREVVVVTEVPLGGVRLEDDEPAGLYRGHLAVLALVKDAGGRPVARLAHDGVLEGPLGERESRQAGRALFRQTLRLGPGRYTLDTAVQDVVADRVSVEKGQFEVPAPGEGLSASSLVLVRRTETAGPEPAPEDPLRMGRLRILPALDLSDPEAPEPGVSYFVTVYPAPGPEVVSARLEIRQADGLKAFATPRLSPPGADGRIAHLGRVPVDRLPPGAYELQLALTQGTATVVERAAFEVPERPSASATTPGEPAPVASAVAAAPVPPREPVVAAILEKAGRYVEEYAAVFRDIVAEEYATQTYAESEEHDGGPGWALDEDDGRPASSAPRGRGATRRTRADLVFVRLPGAVSWGSFRDVFEVDGVAVRDRDQRLERLLRSDAAGDTERARAILEESARYNIGSARRNLNIPTLALLFLDPRNQARFSFREAGRGRVNGFDSVELRFTEVARPAILREDASRDLPAEGAFWIDPARGAILRSTLRFQFARDRGTGRVSTDYRRDPALGLWVPSEMEERYEERRARGFPPANAVTRAVARYSNFRRFTVTIEDEKARLPSPEP